MVEKHKISRKELEQRIDFLLAGLAHLTDAVGMFAMMMTRRYHQEEIVVLLEYIAQIRNKLGPDSLTEPKEKP